jgi:hypothetical protein
MADEIAFLYEAAAELRRIAAAAPDIGEELSRMAEELEEQAVKLAPAWRDRFDRADASRTERSSDRRPYQAPDA